MTNNNGCSELKSFTSICSCCGREVLNIYTVSDSETTVCLDCFKKYYYRCSKCGRIRSTDKCEHNENLSYYNNDSYLVYYDVEAGKNLFICGNCWNKDKPMHNCSYTPALYFHSCDGIPHYFGVELEVDTDDNYNKIDERYENRDGHICNVLKIANLNDSEKNLYIKSDGSLDYGGFEMVSHPMTLDYHMNNMPWKEIMSYLVEAGYLSHNTSTCGLHIHVNRASFGYTEEEQTGAISRLIYFTEKCSNEITRFSRRSKFQLDHWAGWYGKKDSPNEYRCYLSGHIGGKYKSINLEHKKTIEFRVYKGTLNYNTFIASLQLTNELCKAAAANSDDEMKKLTWADFIRSINAEENKELMMYLKKRGIYPENTEKEEA